MRGDRGSGCGSRYSVGESDGSHPRGASVRGLDDALHTVPRPRPIRLASAREGRGPQNGRPPAASRTRFRGRVALNKAQLAGILRVTRPTLYDWLRGREPKRSECRAGGHTAAHPRASICFFGKPAQCTVRRTIRGDRRTLAHRAARRGIAGLKIGSSAPSIGPGHSPIRRAAWNRRDHARGHRTPPAIRRRLGELRGRHANDSDHVPRAQVVEELLRAPHRSTDRLSRNPSISNVP